MSKTKLVDLKVKIDKKSFDLIQNKCFEKSIFWNESGAIKRQYNEDIFCLYFRAESNTLQYGKYEYNFNFDKAKEVTIDDFLKRLFNE